MHMQEDQIGTKVHMYFKGVVHAVLPASNPPASNRWNDSVVACTVH